MSPTPMSEAPTVSRMAHRQPPQLDEDDFPVDAMNEIVPNLWIGDGDAQPDAGFAPTGSRSS